MNCCISLYRLLLLLFTLLYTIFSKNPVKCGSVCHDIDPPGNYTCAEQASFGKCSEPWMKDCQCSCSFCPSSTGRQVDDVLIKMEPINFLDNTTGQELSKSPSVSSSVQSEDSISAPKVILANLLMRLQGSLEQENDETERVQSTDVSQGLMQDRNDTFYDSDANDRDVDKTGEALVEIEDVDDVELEGAIISVNDDQQEDEELQEVQQVSTVPVTSKGQERDNNSLSEIVSDNSIGVKGADTISKGSTENELLVEEPLLEDEENTSANNAFRFNQVPSKKVDDGGDDSTIDTINFRSKQEIDSNSNKALVIPETEVLESPSVTPSQVENQENDNKAFLVRLFINASDGEASTSNDEVSAPTSEQSIDNPKPAQVKDSPSEISIPNIITEQEVDEEVAETINVTNTIKREPSNKTNQNSVKPTVVKDLHLSPSSEDAAFVEPLDVPQNSSSEEDVSNDDIIEEILSEFIDIQDVPAAPKIATAIPPSRVVEVSEEVPRKREDGELISMGDFVQRSGTRFVVKSRVDPQECETFYFVGWNTYYPMMKAAELSTRHEIIEILDDAVEMGLTVMRVWGFSDGPLQWQGAQRYPGIYDEATLVGMDFTLHEASKRGIRLVIAFANYWQHYGGIDQYNVWSYQAGYGTCNGEYACRDDFFQDPVATQFYKDHISMLLNRRNTFNGRLYKEDPAIFGFNMMNEPRSKYDLYVVTRVSTDPTIGEYNITYNDGSTLQTWIEDIAKYVKEIDPVHLLTTGQEGFFGESAPLYLYANPGAWAALEGNDFVLNHQVEGIDYATMHVYVDQWLCDLRGSTRQGQMDFFQEWVEAHQEAAEEELQMPVVLEEFGGKLEDNKRYDMYKFAFESQLASAQRGGSFGGVMFWILYHSDYEPLDHYGGGYGMYLPPSSKEMQKVHDLVVAHSEALNEINVNSSSTNTCVWYPSWPWGYGCRYVSFELELGGMPWECLPGEPENINWCNARGRHDLYQNPPEEWKGRTDGADLPFNTIESLVMGRIRNHADKAVNLQGSYLVVPFSRGIHTIFEGVWERVEDPNERFYVHCWYIAVYEAEGFTYKGTNLCDNDTYGVTFEFTEFGWPYGVKRDRGLKISFHGDIILNPGAYLAANRDGSSTMFSFKDDILHNRLDVSSLALAGASDCPLGPRLTSWPPSPPPPPPPCTIGKHPYRGCPNLEWYTPGEPVNYLQIQSIPEPCQYEDCPPGTFNPDTQTVFPATVQAFAGRAQTSSTPLQRPKVSSEDIIQSVLDTMFIPVLNSSEDVDINTIRQQIANGVNTAEQIDTILNSKSPLVGVTSKNILSDNSAFAAGIRQLEAMIPGISRELGIGSHVISQNDTNVTTTSLIKHEEKRPQNSRSLLAKKEFTIDDFASISNEYDGLELGFVSGVPIVFTVNISATGDYRHSEVEEEKESRDDKEIDLSVASQGLMIREDEPESVGKEDIGRTASDTPNPEERGAASRGGLPILVMAEISLKGLAGKKYRTIAKGVVIPNDEEVTVRGVFVLDENVTVVRVYAEVAVQGLSVILERPELTYPYEIDEESADEYNPCILDPDHSPDAVILLNADVNDNWHVEMCSEGYGQTLRVYEDGEEVALIGHGYGKWSIPDLSVSEGSQYHFVLDGSDHGLPYGSWRGGSGLRITRKSGNPINGMFDAQPKRDSEFVYAKDGKFWEGCKQYAFVGVNTWDLMDIARYPWRRHEVDERLDELNRAGLTVGRTWGFSLGKGVTPEERKYRLQLTPGVYDESVFVGLDYALNSALEHDIRLIISIEDFWLSIDAYEEWSDTMKSKTDFYTDWQARNFYKQHLKNIVHRVNTFSNRTYLDDPTILAWNLMNEPRCTGCAWALQGWIDEMSTHMKALDPNHMVTVGEEGFYSSTCHRVHINPGAGSRRTGIGSSPWALQEGQDFINNHRSSAIDFATVHIWMDNWMGYADYCGFLNQNKRFDYTFGCDLWKEKLENTKTWLAAHIRDVKKLNKPLVVQEFGKTIEASKLFRELEGALLPGEKARADLVIRDKFFKAVYNLIEKDALNGGNTLGSNFWNLYKEGHGNDDPYHVTLSHNSTMGIVADHAYNLRQLINEEGVCRR